MTFQGFVHLTRRRLGTLIVFVLIGVAAAGALLWTTPRSYTATSTAYVRVSVPEADGSASSANAYYSASQLASQKVEAFVPIFTSETVTGAVIDQLNLDETPAQLASKVTASNEENSLTIKVTATAPTADEAREVSDAVVDQAAAQVKVLEGEDSPVTVVLMTAADLSGVSVAPSASRYIAAGLVAGLLLGYIVAFCRDRFDNRLRTVGDITDAFDVSILGVIPDSTTIARTEDAAGDFHAAEALRKLRTNLAYVNVDGDMRILIVTSPLQGDGKSSVAAELAKVTALAGTDVLLVEADLRRPTARETFDVPSTLGLSQVLVGAVPLEQAVHETGTEGLAVLPAGDTPPNPSEMLGSKRMEELMRYLSKDRVVIIDAPPVLPVTDAAAMSTFADGVLMLASAGRTTSGQLEHAMGSITQAGGQILGVVLNKASSSRLAKLRYGDSEYGYGYGYSSSDRAYGASSGRERSTPPALRTSPHPGPATSSSERAEPRLVPRDARPVQQATMGDDPESSPSMVAGGGNADREFAPQHVRREP